MYSLYLAPVETSLVDWPKKHRPFSFHNGGRFSCIYFFVCRFLLALFRILLNFARANEATKAD